MIVIMAEGLTKKQLKELRKLEKLQERNLEQKNNSVKWLAISVVSVLFFVLFVGVILVAKNKNNPSTPSGKVEFSAAGHDRIIRTKETDATDSASQAKDVLTIVEFGDLQCPACKSYHPIVKGLIDAYPDRVMVKFKHFPLISIHPNAMPGAIAAEAAGRQNKFFEFVDLAYEKQEEWSALPDPQAKFEEYAKAIGLDVEKFKKDQADPEVRKAIDAQREEGIANGVSGTPTFFIEGEKIQSPASLEEFKKLIEPKLKTAGSAAPQTVATPTSAPGTLQLQ